MNCPCFFMGLPHRMVPLGNSSLPSCLQSSFLSPSLAALAIISQFLENRMAGGQSRGEGKKVKTRTEQHMIKGVPRTAFYFTECLSWQSEYFMSKSAITVFYISGHIIRPSIFEHVSYAIYFIHINSLIFNYLISSVLLFSSNR